MGGGATRVGGSEPSGDPTGGDESMIDNDLRKLLIAQIGNELGAHQNYLGIALYFERRSLKRWGKLFRQQSLEEAQHAQKIMDFLVDNEIDFDLPALKSARVDIGRNGRHTPGTHEPLLLLSEPGMMVLGH
jgi:hypothetical protein